MDVILLRRYVGDDVKVGQAVVLHVGGGKAVKSLLHPIGEDARNAQHLRARLAQDVHNVQDASAGGDEVLDDDDLLTVGFCGDLKFGRTVHSLISALSRYTGIKIVLISPEELKLPSYVKAEALKKNNIPYEQTTDLESVMPQLDILYMTRVQRERFFNEEDYLRLKDSYILTPEKLVNAKKDLCILHPLPRVNEISVAVDDDPRACYFKQVRNGLFIRMALILKLLGIE